MVRLPPDDSAEAGGPGRTAFDGGAPDLFTPLARRIADALRVTECAIFTLQPDAQAVRAVAVWSRERRRTDAVRVGVVESLAERWDFAAALTQRAPAELYVDSDALDDGQRARMRCQGEVATLTAPLALDDDVIGLVSAVEKRDLLRRFTPLERDLFEAYCQAAAMAIHADALNRRLQERNGQLALRLRERDRLTRELQTLSLRDEMTGLLNRRGFFTLAKQQFKLARRIGHRCTVAFVDVDGMKELNDTWGHAAGDEALRVAACLLRDTFREADVVARIGGDEFVVLLMESSDAQAHAAARRLAAAVAAWRGGARREWSGAFDLSVGLAGCRDASACDLDELIDRADAAMYAEKRSRQAIRRRAG
jgi:diguanylate cyclase (GGDEF)-like protein